MSDINAAAFASLRELGNVSLDMIYVRCAAWHAQEKGKSGANRIFYLSIPPSIFTAVAGAASKAASAPQVG